MRTPPRLTAIRRWFGAARRDEEGVSAVEFGLFAPILFFGLLATVDVGLALYERMTMDHALRAGAQEAMANPGEDAVLNVMKTTAAKNFNLASPTASTDDQALTLQVTRSCACPESPNTAVQCLTICPGSKPTSITYRMSAAKDYEGMIIPSMDLGRSMQVQIR